MTKEEADALKDLLTDDETTFFEQMEALLMFDDDTLNSLIAKKNKLKRSRKGFEDNFITKEEYDKEFAKIERSLFELIDAQIQTNKSELSNTEQDDYYKILCNLDFKHQVKYFSDLIKSNKPILPFVIRANKNYGQDWLINQLVYIYQKETSKSILCPKRIDFNELKINDLNSFFENLHKEFELSKYEPNLTLKKKKISLRIAISEKLQVSSLIFIFRNTSNFIHSDEFDNFFDSVNDVYENLSMEELTHKCIFFFVEENPNPYNRNAHCIFSSQISSLKVKKNQDFKLIDLKEIDKLTMNCMEEWLGGLDDSICASFNLDEFEKTIEQEDGNPEKIIPILCKRIFNVEYENYHSKWIKY